MVFSVYEAEDITTRQYRKEENNDVRGDESDYDDANTEDLLKDLALIEEKIVKRKAYLRLLQARRVLEAIETQIAAIKREHDGRNTDANTDWRVQQWKPTLETLNTSDCENELSENEYRWSNSHLSGVEQFWRPPGAQNQGYGTHGGGQGAFIEGK